MLSFWTPQDTLKRNKTYKSSAKTEAQKTLKIVPVPGSKTGGRRQSDLKCRDLVKPHILNKIQANIG